MAKQDSQIEQEVTSDSVLTETNFLSVGKTVYFSKIEEYLDKPYAMKRHHVYDTRSVTLRGIITKVKGDEIIARLTGNNGFEKDGEEYIFHKNYLLANQNYTDIQKLGQWRKN